MMPTATAPVCTGVHPVVRSQQSAILKPQNRDPTGAADRCRRCQRRRFGVSGRCLTIQPYDFMVARDTRTFADLLTDEGLDFVKSYAAGSWPVESPIW
jgi:hypothetical protein